MELLLIILIVVAITNLLVLLFKKPKIEIKSELKDIESLMLKFDTTLERTEKSIKDEFQRNRSETNELSRINREEMSKSLTSFSDQFTKNIKEVRDSIENQLRYIREDNTKQLDEMRKTVDEKLQKTLNERLSQSFETVGKQLQAVQEGLGEMRTLATDVGGLKKVLSNVKMRGGIGEIQLAMLLEQILAPEQYEANVKTKSGSADVVEFAVKLPGRDDAGTTVWLPIDAKFPKEVYEHLQEAYDDGDINKITAAQKTLEATIKKMAKDISDKYVDPPSTTDFAIMFLPFEGIYAEVVRKAALLEDLQKNFKVIVTGPTTLAAILNSLQMGFKTLAIQKRSGEVWQVLGAVKKEFESFSGMMEKAQKNIQTGLNQLDDVMGKRTRAIQRRLKNVTILSDSEAKNIIPELSDSSFIDDEEDDVIENG
ncbi:MAG: DNA recombination protein RmuC [Bacteroidetes bacterium]|nr:DNA recombination protein RmuC [Bacteroidota bacterium]